MLQFSAEEMSQIRTHATPEVIQKLIQDNHIILHSETLVPPDSRATWNLYYYCPDHGVRLIWDRDNCHAHRCPIDDRIFTGEPYDGAWWRGLNDLNAKACYELGLLWQLTQEPVYLEKVKDILLQYATYYPHYVEHGDIPYNEPGKANAQALCEANCHFNFARGYDFIRQDIHLFDRQKIEKNLLREGAEFLIAHRTPQLHNHEIKISAAVGVIGLILNEERYIHFALLSDYGLHYQLNHGCIGEGMWFEGSIHYHYYALQSLLMYEKIAYQTPYSIGANPNFLKMLKLPLELIMTSGDFPRLNDCIAGQEKVIHAEIFEFGYREYPFIELQQALQYIYSHEKRHNLEALLYGARTYPPISPLASRASHKPYAGYTTEVNHKAGHFLLVKHAPFGGEHDHYDRLNMILCRFGKEIIPDLGTTGYGAPLHYQYYKNSATHNTLAVNETNQSPNQPEVLYFEKNDTYTLLDVVANWQQTPPQIDSKVIKQWDEKAYQDIQYRRVFLWMDECVIDISQVLNPHLAQLDLHYLIRGEHKKTPHWKAIKNPFQGVLSVLEDCQGQQIESQLKTCYHIQGQTDFKQEIYVNQPSQAVRGYGPDNPAISQISYLILRSQASNFSSLVMHDLNGKHQVSEVDWKGQESVSFRLQSQAGEHDFEFNFTNSKLTYIRK